MVEVPEHLMKRALAAKEKADEKKRINARTAPEPESKGAEMGLRMAARKEISEEELARQYTLAFAEETPEAKHSSGLGHSGMKTMKVSKVMKPTAPCSFILIRRNDETGISGSGRVLEGCLFSNGKVVVDWISEKSSVVIWDSLEDFLDVHINSHPKNRSLLIWADGTTWEHDSEKE